MVEIGDPCLTILIGTTKETIHFKTYQVEFFNLDAIIFVGCRVNSKRGTQFRHLSDFRSQRSIWSKNIPSTSIVWRKKDILEAQQVLSLLTNTLKNQNLVSDEGLSGLNLVNRYAKTWQLLLQCDEENLPPPTFSTL